MTSLSLLAGRIVIQNIPHQTRLKRKKNFVQHLPAIIPIDATLSRNNELQI